jgi:hypothetical protein
MAMNTGEHVSVRVGGEHLMYEIKVAIQARVLGDALITRLDLDRFREILERESKRMKEAIIRLRHPFPDRVVGQVAVVADGDMLVAGIGPRVIMALHHVTVSTTPWVVAQVTRTVTVSEREYADAAKHSE